ncbi:hypothetical protein WDU94_008275 [Cyamophila willieti]
MFMLYLVTGKVIGAHQLNTGSSESQDLLVSYTQEFSTNDPQEISPQDLSQPESQDFSLLEPQDLSQFEMEQSSNEDKTQMEHVRRKRGSLDPIIGLRPRRVLHLKDIPDVLTTMDNSRGYRTTFWPLRHRPPPSKKVPFWCLVWIFCWPLLCLYLLTACALTACFGKFFRRANCLLDSLGFLPTCCLMNCCCCCAHRVASKLFPKHVNTDSDPCCKPIQPVQSMCQGGNSFNARAEVYSLCSENINSPFKNSSAKENGEYNTEQEFGSVLSNGSQHSTYSPAQFSQEIMRHNMPSTPVRHIPSTSTPILYDYNSR